ncbi:rhamnan synthesis F family protein [Celeribacter sp.]|uniref:rhamnan synthesis F family protein n=1 Tax=Celeribacter sp. TaxID=1890673 RepID=UPI003A9587AC
MWKLRREALRIWRQFTFASMHFVEQAWFRLYRARHGDGIWLDGEGPQTDKVAIFLVYQPDGLGASAGITCAHLAAKGYSVHLVSNAPLSENDLDMVRPHCARILQRPNHGYDFGGYQKAILDLLESGVSPSRLLLLNDSIWFPLFGDCDLLNRLEAMEADLAGPVYYAHRSPHLRHLQSYMMLFSRRAVESAAFVHFWRCYKMSNNKLRTVRNGEMRLTEACVRGGLAMSTLRTAREAADLSKLSPQARDAVAAYEGPRGKYSDDTPDGADGPRVGRYILTNHPLVNLELFKLGFVKKDGAPNYLCQRSALFDPPCRDILAQMLPEIRDEIKADLVRRGQGVRLPRDSAERSGAAGLRRGVWRV